VAALLGKLLVFKLDAGGARCCIAAHRALHVQQPAVTGIAVGQKRKAGRACNTPHPVQHFGEGCGSGIGNAKR
jgi:hypothetical protein